MTYVTHFNLKENQDFLREGKDGWEINKDSNSFNFNSRYFGNGSNYINGISAENKPGGDPLIAEKGENVTLVSKPVGEISGGGEQKITAEYVGSLAIGVSDNSGGVTAITATGTGGGSSGVKISLVIPPIRGHVLRGADGKVYLVTDVSLYRYDMKAAGSCAVGGVKFSVNNTPASEIPYALAMKIREHGKNVYDDAYAKAYKEAPSYYTEAEKIAYAKSKAEEASKVFRQAANDLATTSGRGFVEDALSGKWLKFSPGYGDLKEDLVICFVRGTLLMTDRGEVAVEDLCVGDLVLTRDHGLQPVRWIGSRQLWAHELETMPNLRPVRIRAGAMGPGVPASDLMVSPQHRVLVRSKIAQKMFGAMEVLVAAKQLVLLDGIDIADDVQEVEYFHILFDRHEVVISNGAETESLYTGPQALKSVGDEAVQEICALFPELADPSHVPQPARFLPSGRQARKMGVRHLQNSRPLVEHDPVGRALH